MNQNLTTIIAVTSLIVALFGALQYFTVRIEKNLDSRFESFRSELRAEFSAVRAEMTGMRGEMTGLRSEMTARLAALDDRLNRIERQVDSMFKPIIPGK